MFIQNLIAKFEFWYAARKYKSERDFRFHLDIARPASFTIEFIRHYPGVIVEYDNMVMGDGGMLHFDTQIVSNPNNLNVESKKFKRAVGHVMSSIINSAVKNSVNDDGVAFNENREDYTVESVEERDLYAEGDSVSEDGVPQPKRRKKAAGRSKATRHQI